MITSSYQFAYFAMYNMIQANSKPHIAEAHLADQ